MGGVRRGYTKWQETGYVLLPSIIPLVLIPHDLDGEMHLNPE